MICRHTTAIGCFTKAILTLFVLFTVRNVYAATAIDAGDEVTYICTSVIGPYVTAIGPILITLSLHNLSFMYLIYCLQRMYRLSPKKCQLFKTQLTYMGNEFSINKRTMTITPLRSRPEAINKIPTPKTPNNAKFSVVW